MTNKERLQANNAKIEEIQNALSGKIIEANKDMEKFLDGTLEEFDNRNYGIKSFEKYKFYKFNNLGKIVLGDVEKIGAYAFYNAGVDAEQKSFDLNTTLPCYIDDYAFYDSALTSIKGTFTHCGDNCFSLNDSLTDVDITINGRARQYMFYNDKNVVSFKFNPKSVITTYIEPYMCYNLGSNRPNPENNIFELDFRNSTFDSTYGAYAFANTTYFRTYFPSTLTSISNYTFQSSSNNVVYFSRPTPATIGANAFSLATNYKIFVPYNNINTHKVATNWTKHADYIYGWAEENTFEQGAMLPTTSDEGLSLTWYSDENLTTPVTSVEDPSKIYYCIGV